MKSGWRYFLVGLAAYLLFIVILFPADRVYALLQQRGELPLQLYQVSGTLWRGHAGMVRIAGMDIKDVDWCVHPWALLLGRVESGLSLQHSDSPAAIVIGRRLDGSYYLHNSAEALPMAVLEPLLNERPFGLTGAVSLDLENIRLGDGRLQAVSGKLQWQQAGLGEPLNIDIGSFELDLTTEDGTIQGALKDKGGPLQAEGMVMLLPDNSYRITLTLASRDKSRSDLKQVLALLGTPSPEGKVSLMRRGRLSSGAAPR